MNNRGMPSLPKASEQVSEDLPVVEEVKAAPKSKKVEVVATRDGFYKNMRKFPGDKFDYVGEFDVMGTWMKCLDPVLEKKHQENQKKRKAVLRASGGHELSSKKDAGE